MTLRTFLKDTKEIKAPSDIEKPISDQISAVIKDKEPKHCINPTRKNTNKGDKICAKCGKPGQRFCLGESQPGKYVYAQFCLECYPHHF